MGRGLRGHAALTGMGLAVAHGALALISESYVAVVGGFPAAALVGAYRDVLGFKMDPMVFILHLGRVADVVLVAEGALLIVAGVYFERRRAKRNPV